MALNLEHKQVRQALKQRQASVRGAVLWVNRWSSVTASLPVQAIRTVAKNLGRSRLTLVNQRLDDPDLP